MRYCHSRQKRQGKALRDTREQASPPFGKALPSAALPLHARFLVERGAMAGGGAWGTNPYGAPQVLKQYGVQYEEYTDPDALEREAGEGDVMIVSIWNRKGTIFEGYHTFAVQKVNGELMVYNRFNNSAESTEKKTMGEVIENGQFIVGYRVQNAK